MNIDQPVTGAAGAMPGPGPGLGPGLGPELGLGPGTASGPGLGLGSVSGFQEDPAGPLAPATSPESPVPGMSPAPCRSTSSVPGKRVPETEDLARDARDFAALMEAPRKAAAPEQKVEEEREQPPSLSAMVSQAMAAWRAPQEAEGVGAATASAAPPEQAGSARLQNTIQTISSIERLVEQMSVSLPSDSTPTVVLRLADDVLDGAQVRLEIADGVLQVAFSGTVPGTDPFVGLNFQELGDKLVDCAGGREVEVTVDGGETGAVETWRFPRGGSRHRRR